MSHEHGGGHGHGGETPENVIQILVLCFLVFPIMFNKLEETGDEITGIGGHGGHH